MKKLSLIWGFLALTLVISLNSCKSDDDDTHTVLGTVTMNSECGYLISAANGLIRPTNFDSEFSSFEQEGMEVKVHYGDNFRDDLCTGAKARRVYIISIEPAP